MSSTINVVEQFILGLALSRHAEVLEAIEKWDDGYFDEDLHGLIWKLIKDCYKEHKLITVDMVLIESKKEGYKLTDEDLNYIIELADIGSTCMIPGYYLKEFEKHIIKQKLQDLADTAIKAKDGIDLKNKMMELINEDASVVSSKEKKAALIGQGDNEFFAEMERLHEGTVECLETGIDAIDRELIFQPGALITLAAQSGAGKSTFALNLADNLAQSGKQIYIFSLEMSAREIKTKLLSSRLGIPVKEFIKPGENFRDDRVWSRLVLALEELKELPIYVEADDVEFTLSGILSAIHKFISNHRCDLIIIDHIGLIAPPINSKAHKNVLISEITRTFKVLARKLNIPVLIVSQLNRTVSDSKDKRPALHHLKDSSSIEQDSNVVMFIHREHLYDGFSFGSKFEAELIIAKNRFGEVGTSKLNFFGSQSLFTNHKTLTIGSG